MKYKLYAKKGHVTSAEAKKSINITAMENMVYHIIKKFPQGCIQDDVLRIAGDGYAYSTVTARFKDLTEKKMVYRTEETRPGKSGRQQTVMFARNARALKE